MNAIGRELLDALAEEGKQVLGIAELVAKVAELTAKVDALTERGDQLRPLADILGLSTNAAAQRLKRCPELRMVGVRVGQRMLFTAEAVRSFYAAKAKR